MEPSIDLSGHTIKFENPEWLFRADGSLAWYWIGGAIAFAATMCLLSYLGEVHKRGSWSFWEVLSRSTKGLGTSAFWLHMPLWCLVFLAGLVALSHPTEENATIEVPEGRYRVVCAGDTSASSRAEYYRNVMPTEPEKRPDGTTFSPTPVGPWGSNKQVMIYLIDKKILPAMPGNQVGLVAFTGNAHQVSPLRKDYGAVRRNLKNPRYFAAQGGGSDPAEGLRAAIQTLQQAVNDEQDLKLKHLIFLFTDGGITAIEPDPQSKQVDQKAKQIWERDFQKTLKELEALKTACLAAGGEPPEVVLVGLGGDQEEMVPLYYTNGVRVRDLQSEELLYFPLPGVKASEASKTRFNEAQFRMLESRIGSVVPCKAIRIPQDWQKIQEINWARDFIGGTKTAVGKRDWRGVPIAVAMTTLFLLFIPALWHFTDAVRRRPAHGRRNK